MSTILQSALLTNFLYPLLLVFFIVFAILEKTEMLGKDKKQLNAGIGLIVALIFVGAVYPKLIVENILQYLSVGLVIIFISLMLWGFISGNKDFTVTDKDGLKINKAFLFLVLGSLVCAILWATGIGGKVIDGLLLIFGTLFKSDWSSSFWANFVIIAIILIVVALVTGWNPFKKKFDWWIRLK